MSLRSKSVGLLFLSGLLTLLLMGSFSMSASAASARVSVSTKALGKHQQIQDGPFGDQQYGRSFEPNTPILRSYVDRYIKYQLDQPNRLYDYYKAILREKQRYNCLKTGCMQLGGHLVPYETAYGRTYYVCMVSSDTSIAMSSSSCG
ncbi:hypothetical protein [Ktedonospora formicarum]|uniref:hypothetical protein n=1 Tax=Ktedonospora formicarum TaxID=2778364 RepID=UPI001C68EF37|nr:hypothetical protein [Ktedonospora formicarum]